MDPILLPTTQLEAVNAILSTIAEAPVNTLTGVLPTDAAKALRKLLQVSRQLQAREWSFNTDTGVTLSPTTAGEIIIPRGVVNVSVTSETGLKLRGGRLYDPSTQSFNLARPITADLRYLLSYDDLPELVRTYVYLRAGRQFQDETLGDASLHRITVEDVNWAWVDLMNWESDELALNVRTDSQSVQRIFQRRN